MWNMLIVLFAVLLVIPSYGLSLLMLFFLSSGDDDRVIETAGPGLGCLLMIPTLALAVMVLSVMFLMLTGVPPR